MWCRPLALLLALCLLPTGALASGSVPTSLRVALVSPQDLALYPLRMMDRDMLSMLDLVYTSVMRIGDGNQPEYGLAHDYKVSAEGTMWTFTLREGVYFHDGRQMTAHDVVATMDAIKAIAEDATIPDNEKGLFVKLPTYCSSWKADGDYTLTVQTKMPYFGLLYAMTFPVLQAQSLWEENPPGTGPYMVEYYAPGQEMLLRAYPGWYGQTPHVSEITGVVYAKTDDALLAFESETVDIVMTRSLSATRYRGTASSRADSYLYATQQLECLMMNSYRELKNLDMRKAVAHAVDKSRIVTSVYQNIVTTTDTLALPGTWLYNSGVTTYAYNPEEANRLLDALGWSDFNDKGLRTRRTETGETEVLSLRICYYDEAGASTRKDAATEVAAMLNAVGIGTRLISYTFEEAQSKLVNRDYDIFLCAYNMDRVPDPNFILLPDGYGNYVYYRSDDMKALCQSLRKAYEQADFAGIWHEIQALMADDLPFLPLYWRQGIVLTRYPYSNVRDIREYELLRGIEQYR